MAESIEQATYSLGLQTRHLSSLVTETLELRSAHLFAQEDAQVPAATGMMDDFEAYSQSQQRQLLMAIGSHSVDPYVEEWARYSAIATLEDITVTTIQGLFSLDFIHGGVKVLFSTESLKYRLYGCNAKMYMIF